MTVRGTLRWIGRAGVATLALLVSFYAATIVWAALTYNCWR